jgi:hypothetical protein
MVAAGTVIVVALVVAILFGDLHPVARAADRAFLMMGGRFKRLALVTGV